MQYRRPLVSRALCVALALTMLSGCSRTVWVKDDMSSFKVDNYECRRDAYAGAGYGVIYNPYGPTGFVPIPNVVLYRACMEARGYRQERQ